METLLPLLRGRTTAVWVALIAATAASWWLGSDHGGLLGHTAASVLVLLVAFFKLRLVGLYFMELRAAPAPLRGLLEGYSAAVCLLVVGMYLAG